MRSFLLFATWSCVSVCSRLADPPGSDDTGAPDPCAGGAWDTGTPATDSTDGTDSGGVGAGSVEHVVVLVLAGVRMDETFGSATSDAAGGAETSALFTAFKNTVVPEGTLVLPGYATGFTGTAGGLGELLGGQRLSLGTLPVMGGVGEYRPPLPSLLNVVPGAVLVANGDSAAPLAQSAYPGAASATFTFVADPADSAAPSPDDTAVIDAVKAALPGSPLVVGVLMATDRTAHGSAGPTAYAAAVEDLAQPLSDFWTWVQSDGSGLAGTVLLVVVADHGRHRWGAEFDARNVDGLPWDYADHGDQCAGCRAVPLFIAGPGVHRGATVERKYTLEDVAATIAFAAGAELPYADGMVIREAFGDATGASDRSGMARVFRAGDVQAEQRWTSSSVARSSIVVDGQQLVRESDGKFLAEDPVALADGEGTLLACWRQLEVGLPAAEIDWPWTPVCQAYDGAWAKVDFVEATVAPDWRPSMAEHAGAIHLAYVKNAREHDDAPTSSGISVVALDDGTWTVGPTVGAILPGTPSLLSTGSHLLLAVAESDASVNGDLDAARYTRHVSVYDGTAGTLLFRTATADCPDTASCVSREATVDQGDQTWRRMENPVLGVLGTGIGLGWLSYGTGGTTVHVATATAAGTGWSAPLRLDWSDRVFSHVEPVWADGVLYWARLAEAGTAEVCRWSPGGADGDTAAAPALSGCVDTGSTALRDLAAGGGQVVVVAKAAGSEWKSAAVSF